MAFSGRRVQPRRNGLRSLEWCAGFFEGEGNFCLNNAKGGKIYLKLQIAQVKREPLDAFCECMGIGKVLGPYGPYQANKQPYYSYGLYGKPAKEAALRMLPFLFDKADQIKRILKQYDQ